MAPMAESPPRLATQLLKFAQGLALHYDTENLDSPKILTLIRRIALHTIDAIPMNILLALWIAHLQDPKAACSVADLTKEIGTLGSETVREVVTRYVRVGVLEVVANQDARLRQYRIRKNILDLLKSTRILEKLPATDVHWRASWAKVAGWEKGKSAVPKAPMKARKRVPRKSR
jgi:hypothetical protein